MSSIAALRTEVDLLTTSQNTKDVLNSTLSNVEIALSNGNAEAARERMENFISKVVNRSHFKEANRDRILLNESNSLICGGANILTGIPLP